MKKFKYILLFLCLIPSPLILADVGSDWIEQWGVTWTFDKEVSLTGAGDKHVKSGGKQ